jgi:Plavaka transposase
MLPEGATITPIIMASDKTQLSQFSGDKSAWPVYITIGNIPKSVHRKISTHANILLGYIPVSKLQCFATQEERKVQAQRLFHYCMRLILQPLFSAGENGMKMTCSDDALVFPILAAYVADFPEQALIACTLKNWCPICRCYPEDRGKPLSVIFADDPSPLFRDQCGHIDHL